MGIFQRIKSRQPEDSEEMRHDTPPVTVFGSAYHGLAPAGADPSQEVWNIVKITYDGKGDPEREQLFTGVSWDARSEL